MTDRKPKPTAPEDIAYMLAVGIPPEALAFIFGAGPDGVDRLTPEAVAKYGIAVTAIP